MRPMNRSRKSVGLRGGARWPGRSAGVGAGPAGRLVVSVGWRWEGWVVAVAAAVVWGWLG